MVVDPTLPHEEDFTRVVDALHAFAERTGRLPVLLGGWEVEDAAITPPIALTRRLAAIAPQSRRYSYSREFQIARQQAADLFGQRIRLGTASITPEQIAILPNSSQGLFLALTALREKGIRRAVVANPMYFGAIACCRHLGMDLTFIPSADYLTGALDIPAIAAAARAKDTVVLLTNPAYSLGVEYRPAQLQELFAALPTTVPILLDETRLGLPWQSDLPWNAQNYPTGAIVIRSPSKIFFLNGVKTSFVLAAAPIIRTMEQLGEALLGSVAGNAQEVALAYLDAWKRWWAELDAGRVGPMRHWKRGVITALQSNYHQMSELLAPYGGILSPSDSGPYALAGFPTLRHLSLHSERAARDQGVLLMTSNFFYHRHPSWQGFRLNLCACSTQVREGIARVFAAPLPTPA